MGVHFFIGRSKTGKTTAIYREIVTELHHEMDHRSIVYLVPDQMTFQAEHALVSLCGGTSRAQVLSFSRLAWRVLKEVGGIAKTVLQKSGFHMLLRKVIEKEKDNFRLYTRTSDKQGFIEQIERMLVEFKRHQVFPSLLEDKLRELEGKDNKTSQEEILSDKLHDLIHIWDQIEMEMANQYIGSEDYLHLLTEAIPHSRYLQDAVIYVDGFHSFTPQELEVLQQLMKISSHITFALTLDQPYDHEPPHPLDLFYQTGMTYRKLVSLCEKTTCEIEEIRTFTHQGEMTTLRHLEQHFEKRPAPSVHSHDNIFLFAGVNRRAEVDGIMRQILKLVQEKAYRFRDIAIVTRKIETYNELLQTTAKDYNIPLFMDEARPMLHHPVMECIRSTLEALTENWRYESLFRTWKTDMFFSIEEDWTKAREEVDILENYVLAYGIKEKHWKQRKRWTLKPRTAIDKDKKADTTEEEQQIHRLRMKLSQPLLTLEKQFTNAQTIRDYAAVLYQFLEDLRIPQKIEKLIDEAKEQNDFASVREHEQVWGAIVELLDQVVRVAGEEEVSLTMFRQMVEAGLLSMTFNIVPPAIDQVTVADMERSRLSSVKVVFLLGVNEGILPATFEEDGLLNDEDREWFEEEGIELADNSRKAILNEPFLIYRVLSTPQKELYLSYALADEEGNAMQPSILLHQLKEMFPNMEEKLLFNEPHEYDEEEQLEFIGNHQKTLSFLTTQMEQWQKGYPISSIWWDVYNWYVAQQTDAPIATVLRSLFYDNKAMSLSPSLSKQLYGKKLKTSVSRAEQFETCPFSHFITYGLRLKERDIYQLEAPDIGQLFHAALKDIAQKIQSIGKQWGELSEKECHDIARASSRSFTPFIQRNIFQSSFRYQYLEKKLEQIIIRAAQVLRKQAHISGFAPVGLELAFGEREELPPLRFTLNDGTIMEIGGRIDRVDKAENKHGVYVRIIDYKSSDKNINFEEVYFGLSLQMLVYLDVILTFSEEWLGEKAKPAGMLYFHVHDPIIQSSNELTMDQLEKELLKKFKMKGLLLEDEEAIRLMDQSLQPGKGSSLYIPAAFKKDGTFDKRSQVLSSEQFEALRAFIRKKLKEIGEKIVHGETEIQPIKQKQQTACTYCPFLSICQFDTNFSGNEYRHLHATKEELKKELFERNAGERE